MKIRSVTYQIIGGANIVSILLMLFVGYSGVVSPDTFPRLSNLGLLFPAILAVNIGFAVFWVFIKPRYILIPLLGFIVCYGPVRRYCPINIPHEPPDSCIKVLSYNVWYFAGWEEPQKPNAILQYIRQQDADIVCMQEATPNEVGQVQIDSILNPSYPYHENAMHGGNCISLYSKYPILSYERIAYESKGNQSVAFKLKVNGREVIVVNNHLETTSLTPEEKDNFKQLVKGNLDKGTARSTSRWFVSHLGQQTQKRSKEARAVARYISYHSDTPMIVCGDFNDSPLSYANRTIGRGLTDCYVETASGPGFSYHMSGMYVRIDNIFCSDHFEPYACRVDNSIGNSDHYPIMCWLRMK